MKARGRWKIGLMAACVAAVLVAYFAHAAIETKQTLAKVHAMTQQMKTVCLGRLTVDIPADADVQYGAASIAGVDFDATAASTTSQRWISKLPCCTTTARKHPAGWKTASV
jgi:hypothetical protein